MINAGLHRVPKGHIAMVVTYLEMTAKPLPRTAPVPDGMRLAPWHEPAREDYRDLMHRIGADYLWYGRLSLSDGELDRRIGAAGVEMTCLWDGDTPVGLAELKFDGDDAEVSFFGVAPTLVGTTGARALMSDAIERAWARPIKRMHLNTCTLDHPKALDFYRRSGFVEYDRAVQVARDPRLNGVLPTGAAPNIAVLE